MCCCPSRGRSPRRIRASRFPRRRSGRPSTRSRKDGPTTRRTSATWSGASSRRAGSPRRPSVPAAEPFQYAIVRVVPRVERGECVNVGVVFFCRPRRFLAARMALDEARLAAFAPELELDEVRAHLDAMTRIAAGEEGSGPVARLEQSERFHWLVAPSSTVIQTSPVHTGLCEDPEETLARLVEKLVA